jgi:hypothetical protein
MTLSPRGSRIAAGSVENEVKVWTTDTGKEVISIKEGMGTDGLMGDVGSHLRLTASPS